MLVRAGYAIHALTADRDHGGRYRSASLALGQSCGVLLCIVPGSAFLVDEWLLHFCAAFVVPNSSGLLPEVSPIARAFVALLVAFLLTFNWVGGELSGELNGQEPF